jgi:hypothetical protein
MFDEITSCQNDMFVKMTRRQNDIAVIISKGKNKDMGGILIGA